MNYRQNGAAGGRRVGLQDDGAAIAHAESMAEQ